MEPWIVPGIQAIGPLRCGGLGSKEAEVSRLRLSVLPLLLGLGGCATGTSGRYDLQTINGAPLPVVFVDEVTAAFILLNDDGTCSVTATERTDDGAVTTDTDEDCTWTVDGASITAADSNGPLTGSVSDGTLTLSDEDGNAFVFVRRSRRGY